MSENASLNVTVTNRGGVIDQLDSPMRTRDRIMTHLTKQLLDGQSSGHSTICLLSGHAVAGTPATKGLLLENERTMKEHIGL